MLYRLIRPVLFQFDAEAMHHWTLNRLEQCPKWLFCAVPKKPVTVMGLQFRHPVGIAAGLDKDGRHLNGLAKLQPAFIEVGTVTPKPQPGNDKPRLFRIPQAKALINRMGFNNDGVDALVERLKKRRYQGIIGVNIGKNKTTPIERAKEDYVLAMQKVYAYADYLTINISSPNTPDLRQLQGEQYFPDLLEALKLERAVLAQAHDRTVPILIKLSPDESDESLIKLAYWVNSMDMDGIIAVNTTSNHQSVAPWLNQDMSGGLSGQPLAARSLACLNLLRGALGKDKCLISVGGIQSGEDAHTRLAAGADLVQVYTGLIYEGPGLIRRIVNYLKQA